MDELSDDELLEALGVVVETKKAGAHTPREERVLAGFEDIVKFVKEHGRAPQHGEERDIFERLYAVRLDRLREQAEFHALLAPHDEFGLLSGKDEDKPHEPQSDDELLAELGVDVTAPDSLTVLKHVKPRVEIQAAEEIAARTPCKDFEAFKPLFDQVQKEIETGVRKTRSFEANQEGAQIKPGEFFILGGQKAYVAEVGDEFLTEQGRKNARMRVIFDNGTEIRGLLRSFQRALYKDEAARWITTPSAGPLFDQSDAAEGDETGTIYVLRSKSSDPQIAPHREVLAQDRRDRRRCRAAHRECGDGRDISSGGRGSCRDLHAAQHQPDQARKPASPLLFVGAAGHGNQGPLRESGQAARMVPCAVAGHRRGGEADQGRDDRGLRI